MSLTYIAIVEEEPGRAVGVWFPDLPGCFSAGDDVDEALRNAPEALALFAEQTAAEGRRMPAARSILALREDPDFANQLGGNMVALVSLPPSAQAA
jgi:predicted RNase H-like HicB family nuclease